MKAPTIPVPPKDLHSGMTPEQFLVWLLGVVDMLGEQVPTQSQWDRIREVAEVVTGRVVAQKMIYEDPRKSPPDMPAFRTNPLEELLKFNEFMRRNSGTPAPLPHYTLTDNTGALGTKY